MDYDELVLAIGAGFHPDTRGDDYASLPEGLPPEDVDMTVELAMIAHDEGTGPDPYERAVELLTAWDGFESQRDLLAATVYNVRAQSPREMTPQRWASIKKRFRVSAQQCLEQADIELEDM